MGDAKTVIIPIDASQHAEQAFDWYCDYIHKPNFTVQVFHCHEPLVTHHSFLAGKEGAPRQEMEEDMKKIEALSEKYKKKMADKNIAGEVSYEIKQHPGHTICEYAEAQQADMIVMGSRGLGTIRRTILGSISDFVLHHAHIPVLVIPKKH